MRCVYTRGFRYHRRKEINGDENVTADVVRVGLRAQPDIIEEIVYLAIS